MIYRLRLLGIVVTLVTSIAAAASAPERGWIFWLSAAIAVAAAAGFWRIVKEPRPR